MQADYALMRGAVARIPAGEAALQGVLHTIRATCPGAAAAGPQDTQSTQLSNELIGTMVLAVVHRGLDLAHAFLRATAALRWSDAALTRTVGEYDGHVRTLATMPTPQLCADVRAWAAGGFATLPSATAAFDARFMPAWVAAGFLPHALTRSETGPVRALATRAEALEVRFGTFEAEAVYTYGEGMQALDLWP